MKILLHSCCGPCYLGVKEGLPAYSKLLLYYYNPNIEPAEEEGLRWKHLERAAELTGVEAYRAPYEPEKHHSITAPAKGVFKERCIHCYRLRLENTALFAYENGFNAFTSTLLVSPWQDRDILLKYGEELATRYKLRFLGDDFRLHFRAGQTHAKELELYRQNYCGCALSKIEADAARKIKKERKQAH